VIRPQDVLEFWFAGEQTQFRVIWFCADEPFDASCARFGAALHQARLGTLDHWGTTPHGALALIVLLDQMSRNLYRGSKEAFSADQKARALAREMVARGFDQLLHPMQRMFVYLPFEHSEDLADQDESVRLFETLRLWLGDNAIEQAHQHRDLMRRYGRFPYRNAPLGRESTVEELHYLAWSGSDGLHRSSGNSAR
jgi:uncharacterized protein (DUF924 family)